MKKIQFFVSEFAALLAKNVITINSDNAEILDSFERHPLNRDIDKANLLRLMNKIRKGKKVTTICVSSLNWYVLDGEHRRTALLALWGMGECLDVTVNVEIIPCKTKEEETKTMIDLNDGNKCWNIRNYAEKLEREGNPSMALLKSFIDKHGLATRGRGSYTKASVLIYGSRQINDYIRQSDSSLSITKEEFAAAERRLTEIRSAFHYADMDGVLSSIFQGVAAGWFEWQKTQAYKENFSIYTAEEVGKRVAKVLKKKPSTAGESGKQWFNYLMMVVSGN